VLQYFQKLNIKCLAKAFAWLFSNAALGLSPLLFLSAVIVDILIEKLQFKNIAFFAMNIAPFAMLAITCVLYLPMILGHISRELFGSFSKFYAFMILFSVLYCIFGKYFLYNQKQKRRA